MPFTSACGFIINFISVKILEYLQPFCSVLPEVSKPERKVCALDIVVKVGGEQLYLIHDMLKYIRSL